MKEVITINKKNHIEIAISGNKTNSIPFSFWTHLPGIDLDPVKLAEETYSFYKKYDIDFIKTMNNGMYSIEDFGCKVDYSDIKNGGVAKIVYSPISTEKDWNNISPASIKKGALARELKSLDLLLTKTNGEVPILFTVFSPITTIEKLSGKTLKKHIEDGYGEYIHNALRAVTETTCNLAKEAIKMGADGIFFASQMSTYINMSEQQYKEFGVPYDKQVLESAKCGWFNTVHAHGNNIIFSLLKNYDTKVLNYHLWETLPQIDEAIDTSGKCIMGGINRMDITNHNKNDLHNQIYNVIKITKGKKLILTPGCVIRYPVDDEMLQFVKSSKIEIEEKLL